MLQVQVRVVDVLQCKSLPFPTHDRPCRTQPFLLAPFLLEWCDHIKYLRGSCRLRYAQGYWQRFPGHRVLSWRFLLWLANIQVLGCQKAYQ